MRAGEFVGQYRLLEDFRVVGAGLSEWTFAERGGREFFLKRFLSPTYPDDDAPGSPATKARKRVRCAAFEAHHRGTQAALAPVTRYGGNLIATLDFFREGAKYYKVTEKVDLAGLSIPDIARLSFPARLVLLKTVAYSLKILHDLKIVHADLKPSNVLIKRTELGYTTKLIDFDSSYVVGNPAPPDEIVGTMNYYSPEMVQYVQGAEVELGTAADIFALGLIYTEYLTGRLPEFDAKDHEAAVAVLNGAVLRMPAGTTPPEIVTLVERMLLVDPSARPSVGEVHSTLMEHRPGGARPTVPAPTTTTLRTTTATKGRRPRPPVAAAVPTASLPSVAATPSTLRGRGLRLAARSGVLSGRPRDVPVDGRRAESDGRGDGASPSGASSAGLLGRLLTRLDARRSR